MLSFVPIIFCVLSKMNADMANSGVRWEYDVPQTAMQMGLDLIFHSDTNAYKYQQGKSSIRQPLSIVERAKAPHPSFKI